MTQNATTTPSVSDKLTMSGIYVNNTTADTNMTTTSSLLPLSLLPLLQYSYPSNTTTDKLIGNVSLPGHYMNNSYIRWIYNTGNIISCAHLILNHHHHVAGCLSCPSAR